MTSSDSLHHRLADQRAGRSPVVGAWLVCLLLPLALGACGSVTAATAIGDAQHDLSESEGLKAADNAPYEYTRAAAYLRKAKELQGMGMYQQAAEYARQSQQASEKALDVARLALDRQKRTQRFAPKPGPEDRGAPGFTPSGE